jgi:hypothetical protein
MALERTAEGLETTLRPKGSARFFAAAFLSFWLCGWAVGETFAVYALMKGTATFGEGRLAVTGFLLVWLSFWTLGGLLAMREWLRLLWSQDRIVVAPEALCIHRRLGPFRRTTTIARADLKRIATLPRRSRLLAQTSDGSVEITALADRMGCETLARDLNEALGLSETSAEETTPAAPPRGWTEIVDAEGRLAVIQDPATRATQAKLVWALASLLAIPTLLLVSRILDHPRWGGLAALLGAATLMSAWGAWRLSTTRLEWRLDGNRLSLRRRSGSEAIDLFEGGALELVERRGSKGGSWFTLSAVAVDGTERRTITQSTAAPFVPRRLGAWMASRAQVPFDDQATEARRAQEFATAMAQLEASGRLGRWMAGKLKGLGTP